jgi:hypothetical protein
MNKKWQLDCWMTVHSQGTILSNTVMQFGYILDFYNSIEVNLFFFFTLTCSRVEAGMSSKGQSHLEPLPYTSTVELERTWTNWAQNLALAGGLPVLLTLKLRLRK